MVKKTYIIPIMVGFFLLIAFPIVNATDISYTFKQNTNANIKISCFDENNSLCSNTTLCYLTVLSPDSTPLLTNVSMTHSITYYNYTLTQTQTTGEYTAITTCSGVDDGYTTFNFEITPTGYTSATTQNALVSFILLVMMIALIYFSTTIRGPLKPLMMFVGLFLGLIGINFITLMLSDSFLQSNINTAYTIFFWLLIVVMTYFIIHLY